MELQQIIDALTGHIVTIGEEVDAMPGTWAFGLGLATWFVVEQILRRIMSAMRWVILIGAIGGLGLSMPLIAETLTGLSGKGSDQTRITE